MLKELNRGVISLAAGVVGLILGWGALVWLLGQLAGLASSQRWLPVSLADMAGVVLSLPQNLNDPASAWPEPYRADLPGPLGFYAVFTVLALAFVAIATAVRDRAVPAWPWRLGSRDGATWSRRRDLRELRPQTSGGRLVLGHTTGPRPQVLAAEARHSVLVWGPSQMYKTVGIIIPALLEWQGPALGTSVKLDVIQATIRHRESRGEVWVFDPTGTSRRPAATWSPLASCDNWEGARQMGQWLAAAGASSKNRDAISDFFDVLGSKLLGPLLFAAAGSGRPISQVVSWINTQNEKEPGELLEELGDVRACEAFEAHCRREERLKGNVMGTAEVILDVYNDPAVAESAAESEIDPEALLAGDNTLYLYAPEHEQERLRPVFEALMQEVMRVAVNQAAALGGSLQLPLLALLDEAAHVACLANLARLANTVAAANIQLVSIWHDLAQLRARYGPLADSVVNGHRAKLLLPGISDPATLEYLSRLIGQAEVERQSVTRRRGDAPSTTQATEHLPLAPVELLRQLPRGQAVLLYGNKPPVRLDLRLWFKDRELRARAS